MFNKINEDFIQSKSFYSSNCINDVKMLWINTENDTVVTISLNSLIYSMKFNYEFNKFAFAEIILNDTSSKLIDRNIYFNNGNTVSVKMMSPALGEYNFLGRIVVFKCIDIEHGMYYMKVYSDWNYLNINPSKFRLGLYNETGMTFSSILNNIFYYQIPLTHEGNQNNNDLSIPLFDFSSTVNSYLYISSTDKSITVDSFIVPNWDLEELLNYVVPFCSSSKNGSGDFVWYENTDGMYITSINDIYLRGKSVATTRLFLNIFQQQKNTVAEVSPYVVYDYEFRSGYNTVELKDNHAGGMNNVMFDYETKKVVQGMTETAADDSKSEFNNINSKISKYLNDRDTFYDKPILDTNLNNAIGYNKASNEYREFGNTESRFQLAQSYANNKITKSLFENYNLIIQTNFLPSVSLGSFVYIDYPSIANSKGEPIKDYSGVWMVVGVQYVFEVNSTIDNQPFYYSIFTLARDSKYSDSGSKFEKTNKVIQN